MKAGIYYNVDGNLHIYVRKDRSIAAVSYPRGAAFATTEDRKVKTSNNEQQVQCDTFFDGVANRVSDVPNGCTDPAAALDAYVQAHKPPAAPEITVPHSTRPYFSGGIVPRIGDISIVFEDEGQDFLRWTIREDDKGVTRVIDCQPAQRNTWLNMIVHNADNLVRGTAKFAVIQRDGSDMIHTINYPVASARRVQSSFSNLTRLTGCPASLAAPYGEERFTVEQTGEGGLLVSSDTMTETELRAMVKGDPEKWGDAPQVRGAQLPDYQREFYEKLIRHGERFEEGGFVERVEIAAYMTQLTVSGETEARTYAILKELEAQGIIELVQDEVTILDQAAWEKAWHANKPAMPLAVAGSKTQNLLRTPPLYDERVARQQLAAGIFRLCGNKSARKHRKQGHSVWWHPVFNRYAWSN